MTENRFIKKILCLPGSDADFEVTIIRAESPSRYILFAAGLGGDPLRHTGFLQRLARHGITVIAPHFRMLASFFPAKEELLERCQRLTLAAEACCPENLSMAGVGHSVGSVVLLMLAGAKVTTQAGERLTYDGEITPDRLVLLTPSADFFRPPGSLTSVKVPVQIWAAGKDVITPPEQAFFLRDRMEQHTLIEMRLAEDAGHFTFMNQLPPQINDPHPDRNAFLLSLGDEVSRFLTR